MAHNREYWNETIGTSLANGGLQLSSSAVARWKLLRDFTVTVVMLFEIILDAFKADTDELMRTKQAGSLAWYADMCRGFQYGDNLQVAEGVIGYAVVTPSKQIVSQVSVRESAEDLLSIKVAKTVGGANTPLTPMEMAAFQNYLTARRWPGVKLNVSSGAADVVYYKLDGVYSAMYDPQQMVVSIKEAMDTFRASFPFDSILYIQQLEEAVGMLAGMISVRIMVNVTTSAGYSQSNVTDQIELPAGYFNYDPNPTITLTAK